MLYLITGGSASGKSEYAEAVAAARRRLVRTGREGAGLYYVAAMDPGGDPENLARIRRHRLLRSGRGFETIECPTHLERLGKRPGGKAPAPGDVFLLECMSNLLANELYREDGSLRQLAGEPLPRLEEAAGTAILRPLLALSGVCDWVVVTNEVFSDGARHGGETRRYCQLLSYLNRHLAREACSVVEVVCSVPLPVKGGLPCV